MTALILDLTERLAPEGVTCGAVHHHRTRSTYCQRAPHPTHPDAHVFIASDGSSVEDKHGGES